MSPRLFPFIALFAFVLSAGASVIAGTVFQPHAAPGAAPETGEIKSSSDEEHLRYRETFFGGSSDRNIRSGQEMKPQW